MIPFGDDNSRLKSTPLVTYILILLNSLVYLLELQGGEDFVTKWAFIPSRFLANPIGDFFTLFTSMFMHASLAHLGGNMLYLWIFGDNVEDRLGKLTYLLFYVVCGLAAIFAQMVFDVHSSIPNVGASGAIAGVLGAYIFMYPQEKITVLVGQRLTLMPALVVIGFWFVLQFASGISTLYSSTGQEGGVAYMAHVGGFLSGLVMAFMLSNFISKKQN